MSNFGQEENIVIIKRQNEIGINLLKSLKQSKKLIGIYSDILIVLKHTEKPSFIKVKEFMWKGLITKVYVHNIMDKSLIAECCRVQDR